MHLMGSPRARAWIPGTLRFRRARFEDVPSVLRLVERAIDRGCCPEYRREQRRAVFLSYAQSMFVEVLAAFDTIIAEHDDQMVGVAQLDPGAGRLRALFVDGDAQGRGHGRRLLAWVEDQARAAGVPRLQGAMSLNAVAFYAAAGYQPCAGNRWLNHVGVAIPVLPMEKVLSPR